MTAIVDRNAFIGKSLFTIGWLERILQKELNTTATFISFTDELIGQGQGFLSLILKVTVVWSDRHESRTNRFVLKATSAEIFKTMKTNNKSDENRAKFNQEMLKSLEENIAMMHNGEVELYTVTKGLHVQLGIPLCYHTVRFESADKPGALILEDLSERGLARSPANGLTVESVLQVMETFAKLHAWSFENREKWHNNPKMSMTCWRFVQKAGVEQFLNRAKATADFVSENFPGILDETMQRCREARVILSCTAEQLKDLMESPEKVNAELGMPDVLVHGDLWTSNLMFEKDQKGKGTDTLLKIIDWQAVHSGCFAEDLGRLLLTSCTAEVRRENTEKFIRHYFDTLTKLMGRQPFTFEQLTQAYKKVFLFAAFNVFPVLPAFAKVKDEAQLYGNPAETRKELLERTKALLEDCLAISGERID